MKRRLNFRGVYVIYVGVLLILCIAMLLYVHVLLRKYESFRPERYVQEAMDGLCEQAAGNTLHIAYALPGADPSQWEAGVALWDAYEKQYGKVLEIKQRKSTPEELTYEITDGDFALARVVLRPKKEPYTRLIILQFQEWEIASVEPIFEPHTYEISLPTGYEIMLNGQKAEPVDAPKDGGTLTYRFENLYLKPEVSITNPKGEEVLVSVSTEQIVASFYAYRFQMPGQIKVWQDDKILEGSVSPDGAVTYEIHEGIKPEIRLEDLYGNQIMYDANREVPLYFKRLCTDSTFDVAVNGMKVPSEYVILRENPDYRPLADYVDELPALAEYEIAVLEENPEILVTDREGIPVTLRRGELQEDLLAMPEGLEEMPQDIAQEVDVLENAKAWSLFMSKDMTFAGMSPILLKDSYQYDVAKKYATGVDITFISAHTLKNPPFSGEKVTNYIRIAPNCFSIDVSLMKHMLIGAGKPVDDAMNDRFYYVKYDDTEDGVFNPEWKLVSMKEIVENER